MRWRWIWRSESAAFPGDVYVSGVLADDLYPAAGKLMGDLLSRVFDGSASAMVLNLIESVELDAEEMDEVRRLISRKAKEQQK